MAIHPSAQIRLIDCLNDIAREKGLTIIISTHSASIIRAQKDVIFLETYSNGRINCIYHCPPAKAIGAIGMREDTNPDIISLVEVFNLSSSKILFDFNFVSAYFGDLVPIKEFSNPFSSLLLEFSFFLIEFILVGVNFF